MDSVFNKPECAWQSAFVEMVPEIEQRLRRAFRNLDAEAREDSIGEAVVHSLFAYFRLYERGRVEVATASTLAWYAVLQVKRGRPAGNRMNGKEPLSRYGQFGNGIRFEQGCGNWIELMVVDKRASVPDQVAAKIDVAAWFATLSRRMKQIARDLASGYSTSEVAEKHRLTPGRISQLRRSFEASWVAYQQEGMPARAR